MKQSTYKLIFVVLLLTGVLLIAGSDIRAAEPLASPIKVISAPNNPKFVYASRGAPHIACVDPSDPQKESTGWMDVPSGFVAQSGAEIHCDLNPVLPAVVDINQRLFAFTWDKRGYLIGLYPRDPLLKPISLVFTIDPTQAQKACPTCFVGQYFDPVANRWRNLPTTFSRKNAQVVVKISSQLPASGYPAYADRVLIALFSKKV